MVSGERSAEERISGPRGDWKTQHNVELRDWCSSPHVIRVIKSRIITWIGRVARMEEKKGGY